jgi:hypothetical protein
MPAQTPSAQPSADAAEALVARLERLARLHRDGDLSLLEYQQAKAALLAAAAGASR